MTEPLPTIKTFIQPDGSATVVCPSCGRSKDLASGTIRPGQRIKIRCSCQTCFHVTFDFRRTYRKSVLLSGGYALLPPGADRGTLLVTDLSRNGVKLQLSSSNEVAVGQKMEIRFQLDNKRKSEICRKVVIRKIEGTTVGCEFLEPDQYDTELGFYLNP